MNRDHMIGRIALLRNGELAVLCGSEHWEDIAVYRGEWRDWVSAQSERRRWHDWMQCHEEFTAHLAAQWRAAA